MTPIASSAAQPSVAKPFSKAFVPAPLLEIRDVIYKTAGIFQADNKLQVLEARCNKRMQALGVGSLREYHECLTSRPMHRAELISLLNEITIGETCFFRNRPQLDGIRKIVLPRIMEAKSQIALRHIRIWSAGCSTGEEPYTLAIMLLEEAQKLLKGWTFEVIATDLNENSIAHAQAACYGDYSIRNTEPQILQKYFTPQEGKFVLKPEVKSAVSFKRVNLSDDSRMMFMKGMDLILCCNVLIYFDAVSKSRVIQHFYTNLFNHGYLFLGHAESLFGISDEFQLVHLPSTTAYVKAEKRVVKEGGK
ncbi:MAG TPA: protein-glutamate O-methyltransferase CheR [Terriglobales bacterium]|nr:protein-glutamate O-methyltransferase CheR [Terriglobales bacterium]